MQNTISDTSGETPEFTLNSLAIDPETVAGRIEKMIHRGVFDTLHRKGAVVGLSGGVDSSVVAALCARALGKERVVGVLMPDRDSSEDSLRLGKLMAETIGIEAIVEDLRESLDAIGCHRRQTEAIRRVFPEYGEGWRCKLSLPPILEGERLNITHLTVESPEGKQNSSRMPAGAYLELIAATNFKQRLRQTMIYHHADRLGYAVGGTSNLLEDDQGFFVKLGDGAADFKPIIHLFKSQVFALGSHLGVPKEILRRPPTTDTFPLPQTQQEFYYSIPHEKLDLCIYALDHGVEASEAARVLGWSEKQIERVYRDIEGKRRATRYLHIESLKVESTE
jgi:NAD+ synthase